MAKIKTSKTGKDSTPAEANCIDDQPSTAPLQTLDPRMISGLLCPKTHSALVYDRGANELISKKAKLAYPIREGVPIMLIEEAREL